MDRHARMQPGQGIVVRLLAHAESRGQPLLQPLHQRACTPAESPQSASEFTCALPPGLPQGW